MDTKTRITYYGHAMFLIESSAGIKIGIDPYNQQVKDDLPDVSADIVLVSHDHFDHSNINLFKGEPEVLKTPGEKNAKGISVHGIKTYHDHAQGTKRGDNILFKFKVDEISFAHMGDLGHLPSQNQLKILKDINVLMLPIGGIYTIDYRQAHRLIKDIKPNIAIPMHYKQKDTKIDVDDINNFLNEIKDYKVLDAGEISKQGLPINTEIWVLNPI